MADAVLAFLDPWGYLVAIWAVVVFIISLHHGPITPLIPEI